jgi:acetyl-CoA C-acetyltransferase
VIVGAGQMVRRPGEGEPLDPIALAVEALRRAGDDSGTGTKLIERADSFRHVATMGWPLSNEGELIAEAFGVTPRQTVRTGLVGGNGGQRIAGATAAAIAAGDVDVAIVTGSEALAAAKEVDPVVAGWPIQGDGVPDETIGDDRPASNDPEIAVGLIVPIYDYALLETAVRAKAGATPAEHLRSVGALWSRFSEAAAENPYAWLPKAFTADELTTPTAENRMVSAPYTKLLTAQLQVDLASALIMCSAEAAEAAGVPKDHWVFPWAGAHAEDEWYLSERHELAASPAIAAAGGAILGHAGISIDDVAVADLYSCFPSAVEIAAAELGLPLDDPGRPLTVTGGLTFAGGPGNNYSGHGIATLVGRLREQPDAVGLASALGWYVTKHAIGLYSARPPELLFADIDAGAAMDRPAARPATADYSGRATLEAYTVPYDRAGEPEAAIVTAITPDGARALVRSADPDFMRTLVETDPLGAEVEISGPGRIELTADAVEA